MWFVLRHGVKEAKEKYVGNGKRNGTHAVAM